MALLISENHALFYSINFIKILCT